MTRTRPCFGAELGGHGLAHRIQLDGDLGDHDGDSPNGLGTATTTAASCPAHRADGRLHFAERHLNTAGDDHVVGAARDLERTPSPTTMG